MLTICSMVRNRYKSLNEHLVSRMHSQSVSGPISSTVLVTMGFLGNSEINSQAYSKNTSIT